MLRLRRPSVRLWQTELFVIVIVVAILILSVSLSQDLQRTLKTLGEGEQLSDASALAVQLGGDFPLTESSRADLRDHVHQFRLIYGDQVWVYTPDGSLVESAAVGGPPQSVLDQARVGGLWDAPPYSSMTLELGGYAVAGKAIYDRTGKKVGSVVIAGPVTKSLAVLDAVRDRLWVTFWIALIVSGLLGLGFAEFIGRRVRQMTKAAAAIAAGDFDQQLPTGYIPDEIFELAESYNRMATTLGQVFSALHEREQEIAAVVESMGEGVIAFDPDGHVRVINPEAIRLLGLDRTAKRSQESTYARSRTSRRSSHWSTAALPDRPPPTPPSSATGPCCCTARRSLRPTAGRAARSCSWATSPSRSGSRRRSAGSSPTRATRCARRSRR